MARDAGEPDATVTDPMNADRNSERPRGLHPLPRLRPDRADRGSTCPSPVTARTAGSPASSPVSARRTGSTAAPRASRSPSAHSSSRASSPSTSPRWIFLPRTGEEPRTLRAIVTDRRRRPLMIVLGILAIATGLGSWAFWGGLGWGFGLVAIGVILWLAPNLGHGARRPGRADRHGSTDRMVDVGHARHVDDDDAAPRRRRYPIQAIGLGAAAVGALVAVIGNNADWWTITTYSIVMGVLLTLIAATVIGAIVNRSWFGIPMLLLLGACTVGLAVTHPNLDGGIGQRNLPPDHRDRRADRRSPRRRSADRRPHRRTVRPRAADGRRIGRLRPDPRRSSRATPSCACTPTSTPVTPSSTATRSPPASTATTPARSPLWPPPPTVSCAPSTSISRSAPARSRSFVPAEPKTAPPGGSPFRASPHCAAGADRPPTLSRRPSACRLP